MIFSAILMNASGVFANSDSISIIIDGKPVEFTADSGKPFIDENNRTLVPFRVVLEQFGAEVMWIPYDQGVVIATKNDLNVRIFIGENYIDQWTTEAQPEDRPPGPSSEPHNTQPVAIDTNVIMKDDRIYVPIRSVLEAFHAQVTWNDKTKTINISSDVSQIN